MRPNAKAIFNFFLTEHFCHARINSYSDQVMLFVLWQLLLRDVAVFGTMLLLIQIHFEITQIISIFGCLFPIFGHFYLRKVKKFHIEIFMMTILWHNIQIYNLLYVFFIFLNSSLSVRGFTLGCMLLKTMR